MVWLQHARTYVAVAESSLVEQATAKARARSCNQSGNGLTLRLCVHLATETGYQVLQQTSHQRTF